MIGWMQPAAITEQLVEDTDNIWNRSTGIFWGFEIGAIRFGISWKNDASVYFRFGCVGVCGCVGVYLSLYILLTPRCNFWLIFKHFVIKKDLHFLQPIKTKTIGTFKGRFLKITPPGKTLGSLYTKGHISINRSTISLIFGGIK